MLTFLPQRQAVEEVCARCLLMGAGVDMPSGVGLRVRILGPLGLLRRLNRHLALVLVAVAHSSGDGL